MVVIDEKLYLKISNNSIGVLTGNADGKEAFLNQFASEFDWDDKNVIIFPDSVIYVSVSYIMGLCSEVSKRFNGSNIFKYIDFESDNKIVKAQIERVKNLL